MSGESLARSHGCRVGSRVARGRGPDSIYWFMGRGPQIEGRDSGESTHFVARSSWSERIRPVGMRQSKLLPHRVD
jgi:hypothetical protein